MLNILDTQFLFNLTMLYAGDKYNHTINISIDSKYINANNNVMLPKKEKNRVLEQDLFFITRR